MFLLFRKSYILVYLIYLINKRFGGIMDVEDESKLKRKLAEIENRCLREQLELIMKEAKAENADVAYDLLVKYKNIWEFTNNVTTSGDSLVLTLPKKAAKEKGIGKGTPVFVALKKLKFFSQDDTKKMI